MCHPRQAVIDHYLRLLDAGQLQPQLRDDHFLCFSTRIPLPERFGSQFRRTAQFQGDRPAVLEFVVDCSEVHLFAAGHYLDHWDWTVPGVLQQLDQVLGEFLPPEPQ